MRQKKTPPYGYTTNSGKLNNSPYRQSALPIPSTSKGISSAEVPQPPDSAPTPVIELGWRELHARFLLIASRLDSHCFVLSKDLFKLDLNAAKKCKELSEEIKRLAERIALWPNLSGAALAGEKSWTAEQYINIIAEAQELTGGRVP